MAEETQQMIPKTRLDEVISQRNSARDKITELEAAVAAAKAGTATEVAALQKTHLEDIALVEAGFSAPYGRRALRQIYQDLPKDQQKGGPVGYLQQIRDGMAAHKADPEKVAAPKIPRILTPYLTETGGGVDKVKRPAGTPPTERSVVSRPSGKMSDSEYRKKLAAASTSAEISALWKEHIGQT